MEKQRNDRIFHVFGVLMLAGIFALSMQYAFEIEKSDHEHSVKVSIKASIENAREVKIAGSFNNWQARCCLQKDPGSNEWSIRLQLQPGVYEYVLIVDGNHWVPEKTNGKLNDGLGGRNSILYVNRTVVKKGGGNV